MKILDNKINYEKIKDFGFIKYKNEYLYEKNILNDKFKIMIIIKDNKIFSKLIENTLNEEYILIDVKNVTGKFNNKIKKEYEEVINNFIKECCILNVYKNKQTNDVINYIKEKYNDDLEFLWEKSPTSSIWRNKENKKWYGILMVTKEKKLDIDSPNLIEIIDLRYSKESIEKIIDNKKIYPGFHMNKKSWITIKLDNSVDTNFIYKLIDNSYNLAQKLK